MSLSTEVQSRYATTRLAQLTNPGVPGGTAAIDTDKLTLAATDIENSFPVYCGVAYDGSNAQHVAVGVEGVVAILKTRLEHPDTAAWDAWIDRAKALGLVTGRNKVSPSTRSTIKPSTRRTNDTPDADRTAFPDVVPNLPGPSERNDARFIGP